MVFGSLIGNAYLKEKQDNANNRVEQAGGTFKTSDSGAVLSVEV